VLTGKALEFGGSLIRTEATGYGNAYFMEEMLNHHGDSIEGKACAVSGSGNVALYCAQKINQLGGKVITLSDSGGFLLDNDGIGEDRLNEIIEYKTQSRGRLAEYAAEHGLEFHGGKRPWDVPCDLAFPCATQNELELEDARQLAQNNCRAVCEGANMPTSMYAIRHLHDSGVLFAPGKASNAGGVAVSGLEMTQNSIRLAWTKDALESKLLEIIRDIHRQCVQHGVENDRVNYVKGANIAGFIKVADAMLAYGVL